jgi:hypothetical protein
VNEKPILCSAPMVRAILEGRETMTRRVVKPQPDMTCESFVAHGNEWLPRVTAEENGELVTRGDVYGRLSCPYGQPGDKLWVRETWAAVRFSDDDVRESHDIPPAKTDYWTTAYKADGVYEDNSDDRGFAWRPSIHMPRWASRITLEIVSVRVERLQDITEADAIAEGCADSQMVDGVPMWNSAVEAYAELWDAINGPGSWAANPWVWVVEFKRLESGSSACTCCRCTFFGLNRIGVVRDS